MHRSKIDDLENDAFRFEERVTKSLRMIGTPEDFQSNLENSHFNETFQIPNHRSSHSLKNIEAYSKLDIDFSKSLDAVKALKQQLEKTQTENLHLSKINKDQIGSIRILTLENDVYLRTQAFYVDQIKKLEESNKMQCEEFENKIISLNTEFKKDISSLKETINQKELIRNESMVIKRSLDESMIIKRSSLNDSSCKVESMESMFRRKINLLEVKS
jgi:hypothetical protein